MSKVKFPWAADNGFWNSDMFEDWYTSDPTEDDVKLWVFLHNWEKNILLKANKNLFTIIEKHINELSNEPTKEKI